MKIMKKKIDLNSSESELEKFYGNAVHENYIMKIYRNQLRPNKKQRRRERKRKLLQ